MAITRDEAIAMVEEAIQKLAATEVDAKAFWGGRDLGQAYAKQLAVRLLMMSKAEDDGPAPPDTSIG